MFLKFKMLTIVVLTGAVTTAQAVEVKVKNEDGVVPITRIIHSPSACARDLDIVQEAARVIEVLTGKAPEIIEKESISVAEVKGSFIIGNEFFESDFIKNELKKAPFVSIVKIANGGIFIGGSDYNSRIDTFYRLFERHGMKFYLKNLREHKLRPGMKPLETIPETTEIVFSNSITEKPRYAWRGWENGALRANPRTTKEANDKVYGKLWSGHAHDLMVPWSVYGETHPEYYALLSNGKRLGKVPSMGVHLCMSNPDLPPIAAANLINWMDQQPWAVYFDMCPGDGPNWCTCKACTALDVRGYGKSDRLWQFANKVAALVKQKYPEKKLINLAYTPNCEMPPASKEIADNCVVVFAPYCWGGARSQNHALDAPVNHIGYKNFLKWLEILKPEQMIFYEYPPSYYLMPSAGQKPTFEKLKMANSYPQVFAIDYSGFSANSFYRLTKYVLAELEWNPLLDIDPLIDDFMKNYYGDAAPVMRKIYNEIANTGHNIRCEYYAPGLLQNGRVEMFYELFNQAEDAVAGNPELLARVQIEKFPYLFVDLMENNPANGKAALDSDFSKKLQEFLFILKNAKNPEYMSLRGQHFLTMRRIGKVSQWLQNICGFAPEHQNIYRSEKMNALIEAENPAEYLKANSDPLIMEPYGMNIPLYLSGNKVSKYIQKDQVKLEADDSIPMAQLWSGDKDAKGNSFNVLELKNTESSQHNFRLDNAYDGQLELIVLNENAPGDAEISVIYNDGKVLQKKLYFDTSNRWLRIYLPAPASELKYGYDSLKKQNTVKIGARANGNKRLLIRRIRMLY